MDADEMPPDFVLCLNPRSLLLLFDRTSTRAAIIYAIMTMIIMMMPVFAFRLFFLPVPFLPHLPCLSAVVPFPTMSEIALTLTSDSTSEPPLFRLHIHDIAFRLVHL